MTDTSISMQILRWIGVLPGAFICAALAMFPIHWLVMIIHMPGENGPSVLAVMPAEMMEYFLIAFFTPLILIVTGGYIAPRFKFYTSVAVTVLWGILFVAATTIILTQRTVEGWNWLRLILTVVLGISGASYGLWYIWGVSQKEHELFTSAK